MPCPTCDHTLQGIGKTEDGRRHFWCPRCGTLRSEAGNHADTEAPTIVCRARTVLDAMGKVDVADPAARALCEAATGRPDR
jgi:transposase-like protein